MRMGIRTEVIAVAGLMVMLLFSACVKQSEQDGSLAGRFVFEPNSEIVVGTPTVWRLRYEAGPDGIAAGGALLFRFPHPYSFMAPQNWFPMKDGEGRLPVAASTSSGRQVDVIESSRGWHPHAVELVLPQGLGPGEVMDLAIGNESTDDPSIAPRYSSTGFAPLLLVDVGGNQHFVRVPTEDSVKVLAGEPEVVDLIVPSQVRMGSTLPVTIRLRDRYGNIAKPTAPVSVEIGIASSTEEPVVVSFATGAPGWMLIDGPVVTAEGVIRATGLSEFAKQSVLSNPSRVMSSGSEQQVFWADLHGHSFQSDGSGTPEEYYRFARGPAVLDVAALSDHEWQLEEDEWSEKQGLCREVEVPGVFVPFLAWEYSLGGHRVIYARDCGYRPPRAAFDGPKKLWQIEYNHEQIHSWSHDDRGRALSDFGDTAQVLADHNELDTMVVPHTTATWHMGNDWDTHDSAVSPLVEIYSVHGSSEGLDQRRRVNIFVDRGSVLAGLQRGYHLGFIACGDSHDGKPGLTLSGPYSGGVTAILAPRLEREAVWEALVNRRTWATTGARILVGFDINGEAMSSKVRSSSAPRIGFEVHGADVIEAVELVADGRVIHRHEPNSMDTAGSYIDRGFDGWATYYLRVIQRDGEMAWSSPKWVGSEAVPFVSDLDAIADNVSVRVRWSVQPGAGKGHFELMRRRGNDGGMHLDGYRTLKRFDLDEGEAAFVDPESGGPGITAYYALVWVPDSPATAEGVLLGLVSSGLPAHSEEGTDPLTVNYFLEKPGEVTIDFFDLTRRLVRRIEIEHGDVGAHRYVWDGRDATGAPGRGLHFCVVTSDGHSTQRMAIRIGGDGSTTGAVSEDQS